MTCFLFIFLGSVQEKEECDIKHRKIEIQISFQYFVCASNNLHVHTLYMDTVDTVGMRQLFAKV